MMIAEIERTPLPSEMAALPKDERGYPVPFFAAVVDGKPDFRILDTTKQSQALHQRLCGICGSSLGYWFAVVTGPKGLHNRIVHDPPMHEACARYSMQVCPYLTRPSAKRAPSTTLPGTTITPSGYDPVRPERMALAIARTYRLIADPTGCVLVRFSQPVRVEWWIDGQPEHREEEAKS